MTITPVVYVGFLLQKTGLTSLLPPALLDGCGLSFASVLLYSLLNPSQDKQLHSTDVKDLLLFQCEQDVIVEDRSFSSRLQYCNMLIKQDIIYKTGNTFSCFLFLLSY